MSALTLPSTVAAVTVFRRGAMVTRTATLDRGASGFPEAVTVEGLPLLLDDDSLQVELHPRGEGGAPIAGDVRVTLAVPEADPELRPPTDEQLEAAKLEVAEAELARADLDRIRTELGALASGARGLPEEGAAPMASPTQTRLALFELRRERLERLRPRLIEADERIRKAHEQLQTLQERERRATQAKNPRQFEARKAAVVSLLPAEDHPASQIELHLRYFVQGARWAPSYVLRLSPTLDSGTLELRALVGQATGERWSDVALTLSTAHPQQWTELPELRSLRIGRAQPPPPKTGWRPPPVGADLLYADYDQLGPPAAKPAPPTPVGRPTGGVAGFERTEMTQTGVLSTGIDLDAMRDIAEAAEDYAFADGGAPERAKKAGRASSAPPKPKPMPAPSRPPPPQAMAPQGMPMMAPSMPPPGGPPMPAAPRSGGLGGMLMEGGGGGAMPDMDFDGEDDDAYGGDDAPAGLVAGRDQLQYGRLYLPAADAPGRGTLKTADRARRYGGWAGLPPEQVHAALSRASVALRKAKALEGKTPPGGHRWAEAADGFDYAYVAQAHVTLDCDGQLHGLPLQSPEFTAHPRYICVPRESADVFRVLVLRNPIDAPLLPGPVDVYLGGRFALASTLELTPPGGRVELGLGVEQAIKVARNVVFDDSPTGMLRRHRELEHQVVIDVRNNLAQAARIQLRERLPVPRHEDGDIELTEKAAEPPWDEYEQKDPPLEGGRAWTVEVPAGSDRTLRATWSIRIPEKYELVGGNRREG